MQTNILWAGIEYHSLENCIIDFGSGDNIIKSVIVGFYDEKIYRADYLIKTNMSWQTYYCSVKFQCNDTINSFEFVNNEGRWSLNGNYHEIFDNCTEVDIPLTPFTNSLPINRLGLEISQETEVDIVYIDLLENTTKPVKQRYRRISDLEYKYENVPNDFEAEIKIDADGFVVDYPELFTRTARVESNTR